MKTTALLLATLSLLLLDGNTFAATTSGQQKPNIVFLLADDLGGGDLHCYEYNNCGSTACATFARFQGSENGGWDFKKLSPSPLGTGTDWGHLLDASAKIGQKWKLITFTPDDAGFEKATAFLKSELDAGRPVVVDFKYIGPQYPNGSAGHTLNVCGYIAAENLYILCNPAVATPGLQLITAADLKDFWRSDHYGALSKGVLSRPAFVIANP